ncbi:tripartite tricarboxylate transporter substrate binding protein [Acidisphaera sp. S103]|uniref:Bug family tripartite tricarboxylate transporter substrate binding protein n=1 Tax=Acidisphaera sp. S103 TaxID=1747223 RepID=UPI00131B7962|nr:tripartite tricarboxylate transporter substrate binding protein [Acidisphaera sp. S103]
MLARRGLVGLGVAATFGVVRVRADGYPDKPIRLLVAFPPGGPSDVLSRIVGQQLNAELGQSVVVDNRPGAGGNVAAEIAAKQPADGYTLLMANNSILAANAFLYKRLGFDPLTDFAPITLIGRQPNILVVSPSLGVSSVSELIALAKAKPGQLNFGSSGNGTAAHLAGELFRLKAGIDIVHVAYPGVAPALTDLMSGQIQMMFATSVGAIPFLKSGSLKALAVSSAVRSPALPDLPTMQEAGVADFDATTWHGLVAPAHTPGPVIDRLNAATVQALHQPDVAKRLTGLGVDVAGDTPAAFAAYIEAESVKWGEVIKRAGVHIG